ncbi:MAG: ABC transporter permease [Peptostreptococcaceae bacterium]|nr:ABC transporter permease [Peptostreptococcaceae bacterium]
MIQYIVRRLLQMVPIIIGISFIIFGIFALAPGDFIDANMSTASMSAERIEELKEVYGLKGPIHERYVKWASRAVLGDWGQSLQFKKPVMDVIDDYIWNSFILSVVAQFISILIAVPIGVLSATKQYSFLDKFFTVFAFIGLALPSFFMGLVCMKIFAVDMKVLPLGGLVTAGANYTGWAHIKDMALHLIMPVFVLSFLGIGSLVRYTRTAMLEVIKQDYIRTARAKGLSERTVIYKHAFRNALIPIITLLGLMLPSLFSGAILTETIFAYPGIGKVALGAILKRDYFLLMGFNMLMAILTLAGNLIADLLYAAADPRVRLK